MRTTLYLTGFMGTGKSAVGKELARLLRRPFVDLDSSIERAEGASVAALFSKRGEASFRRLERRALLRASRRPGVVVALGGGTLIDPRNRALARKGFLVLLTCSKPELVRRLAKSRASRPLLAGGALGERVGRLLKERAPHYAAAHARVSTTVNSPRTAAAKIARRIP